VEWDSPCPSNITGGCFDPNTQSGNNSGTTITPYTANVGYGTPGPATNYTSEILCFNLSAGTPHVFPPNTYRILYNSGALYDSVGYFVSQGTNLPYYNPSAGSIIAGYRWSYSITADTAEQISTGMPVTFPAVTPTGYPTDTAAQAAWAGQYVEFTTISSFPIGMYLFYGTNTPSFGYGPTTCAPTFTLVAARNGSSYTVTPTGPFGTFGQVLPAGTWQLDYLGGAITDAATDGNYTIGEWIVTGSSLAESDGFLVGNNALFASDTAAQAAGILGPKPLLFDIPTGGSTVSIAAVSGTPAFTGGPDTGLPVWRITQIQVFD
jgi:hypothetical protein